MDEHKRHVRWYKLVNGVVDPILFRKFGYTCEDLRDVEGPYLLLCNHNTDYDALFLGAVTVKQAYFVATEKITRMGILGKAIMFCLKPILHSKGKQGINTVKNIMKAIKKGHNVVMFPEGNRSFNGVTCPIPPATGKLARSLGCTLVTYSISGGYLSCPRWAKYNKHGKMHGHTVNIYTHEQLKAMSDQEIDDAIAKDLYVDAYKDQEREPVAFTGKKRAEGLESTLFMCPSCGKLGTTHTKGNNFFCDCGYTAVYDEYGYLQGSDGVRRTVTEIDVSQRKSVEELYRASDNTEEVLFEDTVVKEVINPQHKVERKETKVLRAYRDRLTIGELTVPFKDIEGMAINQRNLLLLHVFSQDDHYECGGPVSFCSLKYLYLFRAAEGSRTGTL